MSALVAELTVLRLADGRTADRRRLTMRTLAREPLSQPFAVTLVDLSTDGCRLRGDFALEQGTLILVKLPSVGVRQARIAWASAGEAGCEFDLPVPEESIEQLFAGARARRVAAGLRRSEGSPSN